ncbi:hypothetical protein D3C85_173410 [compost metagenome]
MTIGLSWGSTPEDSGFIYMDAVTLYTQNYSGRVTQHPVDGGFNISDAFIKDNPKFTVGAVITGADIDVASYLIQDLNGNTPFNVNLPPNPVSVNSTDRSVLNQFIPSSIGQFLPNSTPDIQMQPARIDLTSQTREFIINLMSGLKFNDKTQQFDPNIQIVALYEFVGTVISRVLNNLVLTNITFDERPDTGDALYCNMSFEQVSFVTLKKTEIPTTVSSMQKKSASKKSLSKADSTVNPTDGASPTDQTRDIDPEREAVANG